MTYQSSREVFYFKIPVFIIDLAIHLGVLAVLLHVMPDGMLKDTLNKDFSEGGLYALLGLSFYMSITYIDIKLHERRIKPVVVFWRAILQVVTTYVLFTVLVAVIYKSVPRHLFLYGLFSALPIIIVCHYVANKLVRVLRRMGRNRRNVVMIGEGNNVAELYRELSVGHSLTGYNLMGFFTTSEDAEIPEGAERLGDVDDFSEWIKEHGVDEVYCSLPPMIYSKVVGQIVKICNDNFVDFNFVPTLDGYPRRHMSIDKIGKVAIMRLREEPLNSVSARIFKRTFDIIVSTIFLCTVYPFVVLFVWIGTMLSSPGPLYFRQKRTGYNGKSFRIFKFRSMRVNADADKVQATKDDPRKTKFGDFLRKSSIDELPQFINVLKGEMSIIGPRPHMEHHTEMYSELVNDYMVRHLAKPGITGWAQINGCRGETKTVEEMADRVQHDIWYIENWTPLLDVEIFFKTFWQAFSGKDKQAY